MATELKIESGVQLLARLTKRPSIEKFYPQLFQTGPTGGDLIEIYSDTCTSPFLIDVISELLISTKPKEVSAEVLIFDIDGNLNYEELVNGLKKKIQAALGIRNNMSPDYIKKEVGKALACLHISNIYDATQFYTTILNLENSLIEHPKISLIIFNTLTAFYWSEQGFKITKMDLYTKSLINIIQKITKEFKVTCMYTRPEYFCTNKEYENVPTVNYRIQLLEHDKGHYQINLKTSSMNGTKLFKVIDGELKWML